jgi:ubiquinone biosynthesis protein
MWETSEPFLKEWLRSELGPEAYYADKIVEVVRSLKRLPDIIRKIDASYPEPGAAPPPPLAEVTMIERPRWLGYIATALIAAAASAAVVILFFR